VSTVTLSPRALQELAVSVLVAHGTSAANAAIVAEALVAAEADGPLQTALPVIGASPPIRSDAEGRFELEVETPERGVLSVSAADYLPRAVEVEPGRAPLVVELAPSKLGPSSARNRLRGHEPGHR